MATPTIRETVSGSVLYTASGDTVTVSTSSAVQANDWLVAVHALDYGSVEQMGPPSPGVDWQELVTSSDEASLYLKVWARQVPIGGVQSISVSHTDPFADSALIVLVVAGADQMLLGSNPSFNIASAVTPHVATQVDPTDANELLICGWLSGRDDGAAGSYGNYTAPSGMTKRAEVDCAPYSTAMVATQALTSSALTGSKSATFAPNTTSQVSDYVAFSLTIREDKPPLSVDTGIAVIDTWTVRKEVHRGVETPIAVADEHTQRKEVHRLVETGLAVSSSMGVVKDVRTLPAGGPIFLTLWLVTDDGSYLPLPDFDSLQLSPVVNDPGSVSVSYPESGLNFGYLHAMIEDDRDIEVAIWPGGREDGSMHAILTKAHGDEVEEQALWSFDGYFLEKRMDEAFVWPADPIVVHTTTTNTDGTTTTTEDVLNPNRETVFENATAGEVMQSLMEAAHERGTLTDVHVDSFNALVGTNGKPFTVQATMKLSPGTTYTELLGQMTELGMCEWEVTGRTFGAENQLRLYEPGTRGKDRTEIYPPIVLRAGKDVTDSPRTYTADGTATHMLGSGKDGIYEEADDSVAEERRGKRIEKYISQGSINDGGTLQAYLQAQLAADSTGKMELSHGLTFPEGGPVPIADFDRYDWVWSDQGWGLERLRVSQWTIAQDSDGNLTGSAVLNDLTSDWEEALAKRLARLEGGSVIIGTPTPDSPPPANGYKRPAAPTGLVATSLAYQDLSLGTANTYASVTAGWSEVLLNEDASDLTVSPYYRLRYRYLDGIGPIAMWPGGPNGWQKDAGDGDEWIAGVEGSGTTLSFSGLSPSRGIEVQVATVIDLDPPGPYEVDDHNRAFRRSKLQSHWSDGFELTTDTDTVAPGAPSTPVVFEYLGTARITWDGKDLDGLSMPPDFSHVEVHFSTVSNFTPSDSTYRDSLYGASATVITDLLYEVGYFARLVAVDIAGNRSDPSAQGLVTTRKLLGDDIFAGAVGSVQLAYAAVKEANIDYLAVNNSHIQNLNVGKLTSGKINADMLLAGRIKTADMGARIEMDSVGFRQYNSLNELRTQFLASNGDALITGLIRSATSGERFELNPDGTLRVYPEAGSNYSAMFNAGDEIVFRSQTDVFGQAGFLRLAGTGIAIQYGWLGDDGQDPDAQVLAQVTVQEKNVDSTAPVVGMRSDQRYSTADSDYHRVVIVHNDDDGDDIPELVWHFYQWNSDTSAIHMPGRNGALLYNNEDSGGSGSQDHFALVYNNGNGADLHCGNITNTSGADSKENITELPFDPLDLIRSSPAKEWQYRSDGPGEGSHVPDNATLAKIRKRKPGTDPKTNRPEDFESVDMPAARRTPSPSRRVGPMADDIQKIAPSMVRVDSAGNKASSLNDKVGVLWKAIENLSDKVDELTDKFADIQELPGRRPGTKQPRTR